MLKIDSGFFSLISLQLAPKNLTHAKMYFVWVVMSLAFSLSLQGSDKVKEREVEQCFMLSRSHVFCPYGK